MNGILSGYRVLDFGRYISGPFCAALLADMGAEVIRVEGETGSDDRYVMPIGEGPDGGGAVHHHVNRNKRSLCADITTAEDRAIIEKLIRKSDVVIVNLPPKALTKLGLDYDTLRTLRPDIILTTVNAYGVQGPSANDIGFDCTGQALSGAMALTGMPSQPYRSPISYVDYSTAISAALGTVAALLKRERTGEGEHVHCSLLKTALTISNTLLIEEASGARSRVATGSRSPISGPSDLFRAKDGWVMIQIIGNAMFRRWTKLVGAPELADDPRFADDQLRGDNGEELSRISADWVAGRTVAECLEQMQAYRLPVTPMLTPAEALNAPEVIEGRLLDHVKTQAGTSLPIVSSLCEFAGSDKIESRPAPRLGTDTEAILAELNDAIERTDRSSLDGDGADPSNTSEKLN